ncbi:MAG: hypothetical protein AB7I18_14555 [Candidatus Berkiella sp.]
MRELTLNEQKVVSAGSGDDEVFEIVGQILFEVFVEVFAQLVFELLIQSIANGIRNVHDYFYPPQQTLIQSQFVPNAA